MDRPAERGTQEAGRKGLRIVDLREETGVALLAELHAQHGVDHCVEGDVVHQRGTGEETRMSEDHMMEFMQDEHEQVLVGAAVFRDELRIEPQAGPRGTIDAGSRHRVIGSNIEQAQKLLHLPRGGWHHIENAAPNPGGEGVVFHRCLLPRKPQSSSANESCSKNSTV